MNIQVIPLSSIILILGLIGCGLSTQDTSEPTVTHSANSAPTYKEIRRDIVRIWREAEVAYATATPLANKNGNKEKIRSYIDSLKGKEVQSWQGWVLHVQQGAQGLYTVTIDMDEFYDVQPPLGSEYRGIRLIGLADVVLSGVDPSNAQKVTAGQKVEFSGTIYELKRFNRNELFVDPAVQLAVVLFSSKVMPTQPSKNRDSIVDNYKDTIITLKNPVCERLSKRPCYTYNLIVYGTGKIAYTEEDWETGRVTRTETARVSEDKVKEIVSDLDKLGYFSLDNDYEGGLHCPVITTSITFGEWRNSIFHGHCGHGPDELAALEGKIDQLYRP